MIPEMHGLVTRYNFAHHTSLLPYIGANFARSRPSQDLWATHSNAHRDCLRAMRRGDHVVSLLIGHDWSRHLYTSRREGFELTATCKGLYFTLRGVDRTARHAIAEAYRSGSCREVSYGTNRDCHFQARETTNGSPVSLITRETIQEISIVKRGAVPGTWVRFSNPLGRCSSPLPRSVPSARQASVPKARPIPMSKTSRNVTAAEMVLVAMYRTGCAPTASPEIYTDLYRKRLIYRDGGKLKLTAEGREWAKRKSRIVPADGHSANAIGSGGVCDLFG